ncbi:MAG: molecular chaperone DnaJ [Candidatus Buchananbacteria bacterium]
MAQDYYKTLGVNKSASADEIKRAFRKLAHEYHPDKKTGNAEKFKEINEAYQTLGNEDKRRQYDQFGQTFPGGGRPGGGYYGGNPFGQGFGGFNQGNVNFDFGDAGDLGDIFGSFFGGAAGGRQTPRRGADLQTELTIDFKEAVFGAEKTIELNKQIICDICGGSGAEPGSKINTCKTCNGRGRVVRAQQTFLGTIQTEAVCPQCQGAGQMPENKCHKCHGNGHVRGSEKIKITIPAGIDNGQSLRLSGKGEAGEKGRSGDLLVRIRVRSHAKFRRDGFNIYSAYHLSVKQAILGDKVEIETVDGSVNLKIPEGTQSQTKFKLPGKGVTHLNARGRGDQIVEVIVDIPKNLSRADKKLLEQIKI